MHQFITDIENTSNRALIAADAVRVALEAHGLGGIFGAIALFTGTTHHTSRSGSRRAQEPISTVSPQSTIASGEGERERTSAPLDALRKILSKPEHPLVRAAYDASEVLSHLETTTLPTIEVLVEEYPDQKVSSHHGELVSLMERPGTVAKVVLKAYNDHSEKIGSTIDIFKSLEPENIFKFADIALGSGREVLLGIFVGCAVLPEVSVHLKQVASRLRAKLAVQAARASASQREERVAAYGPGTVSEKHTSSASAMQSPVRIFFLYHPADEPHVRKLEGHLTALRREERIVTWGRHNVRAGEDWRSRTNEELERADLVLLLVSGELYAPDEHVEVELEHTRRREECRQSRVIPINIRPFDAGALWFTKLDALPRGGQTIMASEDQDGAWRAVTGEVRRAVDDIARRKEP